MYGTSILFLQFFVLVLLQFTLILENDNRVCREEHVADISVPSLVYPGIKILSGVVQL